MKTRAALLFAATALSACSLRYDFTECSVDADCRALETSGTYYMCSSEQCIPDTAVECRADGDCEAGETCEDNSCVGETVDDMGNNGGADMGSDMSTPPDMSMPDMPADTDGDGIPNMSDNCPDDANSDQADLDRDGVGDVCDPESFQPCDVNSECTGEDEFCIAGSCRDVTTDRCPEIIGDADSDDVIFIGSILPLGGPYIALGPALANSYELALDDLNSGGGIRGNKVAIVSCDDVGNADLAKEAAAHLVGTVGVQAILGPIFSTPFIEVVTQVTKDAGVLTLTPTATAPEITTLDDNDLAWRLLASDVLQAEAIMERLVELNVSSPTIFVKDDAYGNGLFSFLRPQLINRYGTQGFVVRTYADPATLGFDQTQIATEFSRVIGEAATANPTADHIVAIGTTEAVSLVSSYYSNVAYVPTLFSHGATADMPKLVQANNAIQATTNGIAPNIFHPVNFPQYDVDFRAKFSNEPPLTISTLTYDSLMVVAFAVAGIPEGEAITGAAIAGNMARLVDKENGEAVSYSDPDFVTRGRSTMQNGGSIDYVGVSGEVDFDLTTGDVRQDYLNFVAVPNPQQPSVWTLDFNRTFLLGPSPSTEGDWFGLCADTSNCAQGTQACVNNICLDICDPQNDMCTQDIVACTDTGQGFGVCAPQR